MNLNNLLKKYKHLFQFQTSNFEFGPNITKENHKVIFEKFNSKRRMSHPFYKPISKMINAINENIL